MPSPLRIALRDRLKAAMRARDRQTTAAMRSVLAALENAEAVPVVADEPGGATSEHVAGAAVGLGAGESPRRHLSRDDERAVVEGEVAELRSASAALTDAGHHDRGAELIRVAETIEGVLRS